MLAPGEVLAQGALTNGANHGGDISSAGEIDSWTFTANAGDSIVLSVGEVGGDSELYPYIRLLGPNSALVTYAAGTQVARIAATAPLTGTYTVLISSNDVGNDGTGDYLLTLAHIPETPVVSGGDQGGPMINGANHAGEIHVGDMDQWTFTRDVGLVDRARRRRSRRRLGALPLHHACTARTAPW